MKQSQGWNSVIRFDSLEPVDKAKLPVKQKAAHTVCEFANEFIEIFNTQPLGVRLVCVGQLFAMVNMLALSAFLASARRLPYVEPHRFEMEKNGKPLPPFSLVEERPTQGDSEGA